MVKAFAKTVMANDRKEIEVAKSDSKLSVVFDEWSSIRGRRYINTILLNGKRFWNLGLIRIRGSATAQNCLALVKSKLGQFDINFQNDIVSIITDGCNVMKCIGNQIKPINQQLCFAHAIQLAVLEVLYDLSSVSDRAFEEDLENMENGEDDDGGETLTNTFDEDLVPLNYQFKLIIQNVRSIVSKFKRSPKKTRFFRSTP